MTRRKLLGGLVGAAAAAVAYPIYLEPRWLEASETPVRLPKAGWTRPLRLLHLSDLHASSTVSMGMIERAVDRGLAARPDLICITGDFITAGQDDFDAREYTRVLRRLSGSAPAFAVLGNHDGGVWAAGRQGFRDHGSVTRLLESSGVELLHNRAKRVEIASAEMTIAGVGDLWSDEIDAPKTFTSVDQRLPIILLSHNPDSKDVLRSAPWDLMLSGHTHGGQVIIPFAGPRYAPVIDKRFVAGLSPWEGKQIYVTRGVGNLYGVRFRCRPEVSLLLLG